MSKFPRYRTYVDAKGNTVVDVEEGTPKQAVRALIVVVMAVLVLGCAAGIVEAVAALRPLDAIGDLMLGPGAAYWCWHNWRRLQ